MAQQASSKVRFVIFARQDERVIQESRANVASAIVLARKWRDIGLTDVTVLAPTGELITPESFAASLFLRDKWRR